MEPKWGQDGVQTPLENLKNRAQTFLENRKAMDLIRSLHFPEKVANMVPSWDPRWSQNGPKIHAKNSSKKLEGF